MAWPCHDHRFGPCDLPTRREAQADAHRGNYPLTASRCRWEVDLALLPQTCGCPMCTGKLSRRMDRRADRQRARRELRRFAVDGW